MPRHRPISVRRTRIAVLVLGFACLPVGCASVHPSGGRPGEETTLRAPGASLVFTAAAIASHGPTGVLASGARPAPDLDELDAPDFRRRVLAQQRAIRSGPASLPRLAAAWEAADPGSHRRRTLTFLIVHIQQRRSPEDLARALAAAPGIRRIAAVRAASAHGAVLVPALLDLITDRDPEARREAIVALRAITDRHPSASGRGPVHAIRVWRAWYETSRHRSPPVEPRPAAPKRPRTDRPLAVSM